MAIKIKTMNKISNKGLALFDERYEVGDEITDEDAILVRSAKLHDYPMGENLKAIARAGAGTNNIPVKECADRGIVVFNTPGANANAVKELVLCSLFLSSRRVLEGIEWTKTITGDDFGKQVEAGKKQFVGPEIEGKTLGIIGLGAIGVAVANAAVKLGMNVIGYDPYISVNAAWKLSKWVKKAASQEEIFQEVENFFASQPVYNIIPGFGMWEMSMVGEHNRAKQYFGATSGVYNDLTQFIARRIPIANLMVFK